MGPRGNFFTPGASQGEFNYPRGPRGNPPTPLGILRRVRATSGFPIPTLPRGHQEIRKIFPQRGGGGGPGGEEGGTKVDGPIWGFRNPHWNSIFVASAHILDTDASRRLQDASKTLQDAQNHPLDAPKSRPRRENGASEHPKTNDFLMFFRLVGKLA